MDVEIPMVMGSRDRGTWNLESGIWNLGARAWAPYNSLWNCYSGMSHDG